MPIDPERVGTTFDVEDFVVSAERLAAYADATCDPLPAYRGEDAVAPPVFGVVPVWPAIERALADPGLDLDVGRIVHGEQRTGWHRPIRAGDVLSSTGTLASLEEKGSNEVFVLSFATVDAQGQPVVDQDVVCVSRGTASGQGVACSSGPQSARPPVAPPENQAPAVTRRMQLPDDITYRYAEASRDDNRIHIDPEFAVRMGLPGIIVHGLCMLSIALQGVVEEVAGGAPGRLASVAVRFSRPLQPGNPLETRIWRTPEGARFESAGPDGKTVLKAGAVEIR